MSAPLVKRLSRGASLLILVGGLAGCAVSMPMASLMPDRHHDDDQTGSIIKPKLAEWVGHEDWKSAAPAFSQALEDKGSSGASWDNPKTGAKGRFMAVGDSFPGVSGQCRAFHASLDHPKADKALDGTACADKTGEWQVTEMKPEKKG
jgi:surface antigen